MRFSKAPVILLIAYWILCFGLYGIWAARGWYPATGDEPHHIIIGRSILHHGTFEQSQAYRDEFAKGNMGRPGDSLTRANAHIVQGPEGFYSIHSPGTGIVALLPIAVSDLLGSSSDVPFVKSFLILLSGLAVLAVWKLALVYVRSTGGRVLAVLLTCFGLPLVLAANQVFPDLPAGVLGLCILTWLATASSRPAHERIPLSEGIVALCAVACLPWLHYKLSVLAAVLAIAVLRLVVIRRAGLKPLAAMCVIPAASALLFFTYNIHAFGSPLYLQPDVRLHADSHALMWFLSLNLDRWHGLFLQNPAFIIALLFLVPFVKEQTMVGATAAFAYLGVIGMNAMHSSPGYSFAGRHAWTGCLMLIPATVYGIGRLERQYPRALRAASVAALSIQIVACVPLAMSRHDLYNRDPRTWFDVYPSFLPAVVDRFLPAFYSPDWWYRFAINYVFILIAGGLICMGAASGLRQSQKRLAMGAFLALAIFSILVAGIAQPNPPRLPRVFSAKSLFRKFGSVEGNSVTASKQANDAGIWTFGPYIPLAKGAYRVTFHLESDAPADVKVGTWDVTSRLGRIRLGSGAVMGTLGKPGSAGGIFRVESREDGGDVEMRLFFEDLADVRFDEVVLEPSGR
jgi:hypothetical protein